MTQFTCLSRVVGAHAQFFDLVGMLKIERHVKKQKS